jgi:hypothetical protein
MIYGINISLRCGVHYKTYSVKERANISALLCQIKAYRASDVHTLYKVKSQGIEVSVKGNGLLHMAIKGRQLCLFLPRDDATRKDALDIALAKELIRFLGIAEAKAWQTVTALLAVSTERLGVVLAHQGIYYNEATTLFDKSEEGDHASSSEETYTKAERISRTSKVFPRRPHSKNSSFSRFRTTPKPDIPSASDIPSTQTEDKFDVSSLKATLSSIPRQSDGESPFNYQYSPSTSTVQNPFATPSINQKQFKHV